MNAQNTEVLDAVTLAKEFDPSDPLVDIDQPCLEWTRPDRFDCDQYLTTVHRQAFAAHVSHFRLL